jgi:hypothetical protein
MFIGKSNWPDAGKRRQPFFHSSIGHQSAIPFCCRPENSPPPPPRPSLCHQDNILISNVENTNNLAFHVLNGGDRAATLEIADFWAPARADVAHVCFTLNDDGHAEAYMNGESKGSSEENALPNVVTRANMFIGKSNWPDAGKRRQPFFHSSIGHQSAIPFCCRPENSPQPPDLPLLAQHALIDELRIYEYALSADEVSSLYAQMMEAM